MENRNIFIKGEKVPVCIIKSSKRKKSVSLKVTSDGLTIRTPINYKNSLINKLLTQREEWIYKSWLVQKQTKSTEKEYTSGEPFLYKGRNYRLKVSEGDYKGCKIEFHNGNFIARIDKNIPDSSRGKYIKRAFNERYRNKAKEILKEEAENLAEFYGFDIRNIIVKSYKSKYGQCRGKDIYFNYSIIKFPLSVIRHIILHELCHIEHKNHNKKFWNSLAALDNSFKENKKWLEEKGNVKI